MTTEQKDAQRAMFSRVQNVDNRLGKFVCFLYPTGCCEASHHLDSGKCLNFAINDDTENPWKVVVELGNYIASLSEPQMATGPDGRWIIHEGTK